MGPSEASPPELAREASDRGSDEVGEFDDHEFKPVGTVFILGMFVLTLVLLWLSVYVILLSRGVTA